MAEHNKPTEALANYDKAIKLDDKNPEFYKGRAARLREPEDAATEAIADWEKVLALLGTKATDRLARRDARRHMVTIDHAVGRREEQQYRKRVGDASSPAATLEAGYFLVEYYGKRRHAEGRADRDAREAAQAGPRRSGARARPREGRTASRASYDEAVALLLELAKAQPSREREVYQQIAEIKTEARKDDEAIEWQQKALAKNPQRSDGVRAARRALRRDAAVRRRDHRVREDGRSSIRATRRRSSRSSQLYVQSGQPMKAAELLAQRAAHVDRRGGRRRARAARRSISRR